MNNSNDNPEITSNSSLRSETSSHVTETPTVETFIIDDNNAEFQLKGRRNEKSTFKHKTAEVYKSTSAGTSASPIQSSNGTSSESASTSHETSNTNLNQASNSVLPDSSVTGPVSNVSVAEARSFRNLEDFQNGSVETSPMLVNQTATVNQRNTLSASNTNLNPTSDTVLPHPSITEPASNVPVAEAHSFHSFEDSPNRSAETSSTPINQISALNQINALSAVNSPHSCRTSAIIDSLNTLTSNVLRRYRSLVEADANIDVTQRSVRSQIVCDSETDHSDAVTITPSPVPPCISQGPPPLAGAPPSYSAVMRIGQDPDDHQRDRTPIRIQPSPPFIAPVPPPTYSQAQGFQVERPVIIASVFPTFSVDQLVWGPTPVSVICPRCAHVVVTTTQSQRSNLTHFSALGLCLCGCWPCCLLPYCMDTCKNIYHYCPNCTQFLGMYRPW